MTYAIVKTGGKQYRVEPGQSLLVERLGAGEGDKVALEPLLYRDDKNIVDGASDLEKVKVEAKIVGHERGPKIRVLKFKAKKRYKVRSGHRQALTRIEITDIKMGARAPAKKAAPATAAGDGEGAKAAEKPAPKPRAATKKPAASAEKKPAAKPKPKPKPKDDE